MTHVVGRRCSHIYLQSTAKKIWYSRIAEQNQSLVAQSSYIANRCWEKQLFSSILPQRKKHISYIINVCLAYLRCGGSTCGGRVKEKEAIKIKHAGRDIRVQARVPAAGRLLWRRAVWGLRVQARVRGNRCRVGRAAAWFGNGIGFGIRALFSV